MTALLVYAEYIPWIVGLIYFIFLHRSNRSLGRSILSTVILVVLVRISVIFALPITTRYEDLPLVLAISSVIIFPLGFWYESRKSNRNAEIKAAHAPGKFSLGRVVLLLGVVLISSPLWVSLIAAPFVGDVTGLGTLLGIVVAPFGLILLLISFFLLKK